MDLARFTELVDAYGAVSHRWPADERAAALVLLRAEPRAAAAFHAAADLDDQLGGHTVPPPSAALRASVLASASTFPALRRRVRLWWTALALATVGAGGVLAGSAATAALLPVASGELHEDATAFGGLTADADG